MNRLFLSICCILTAVSLISYANESKDLQQYSYTLPLIGDKAPAFTADSTQGEINFPTDYKGSWVILFSHPADFTPVCTTEFMKFASMQKDFEQLHCKLIGLSVDSKFSHIAWLRTIKEKIEFDGLKNIKVTFPVIDDVGMKVAHKYGMIQPGSSSTQPVRAVFYIDPKGIIRALMYYPASVGRNFEEIKRVLIALQTTDKEHVACPADWKPGKPVIVPPPGSCGAAKERVEHAKDQNLNCVDWFLCFKELPMKQ